MVRFVGPIGLVAVFTFAAVAACASHPSERFPEYDAMCGAGSAAYQVERNSAERFPNCSIVRWDGAGEGGHGQALCCPN